MNHKLLLISCITLLYRESQTNQRSDNSAELVKKIVARIKLPEQLLGIGYEREVIEGLRNTALEMADNPPNHDYTESWMIQRLQLNCNGDTVAFDAARDGILGVYEEELLLRTCSNLRNSLKQYVQQEKVKEIISKTNFDLTKKISNRELTKRIAAHVQELEPYMIDSSVKDPAVIDSIDIDDEEGLIRICDAAAALEDSNLVLRTGWQGWNRMLDGGFRPAVDNLVVLNALEHQYKTGTSLTLFKQLATVNYPILRNPNKKPLMVRFSFEDSLDLNFKYLYSNIYENEHRERPNMKGVDSKEIARYVKEKLKVTGYHTKFEHINPQMWTYRDMLNRLIELESQGYEIHVVMCDYLYKLPTTGCDVGPMGKDVMNLFERVKSFMAARKIIFITPHQLNTMARDRLRQGATDMVKSFPKNGLYKGSTELGQIIDLDIYQHIEHVNGKSYMSFQRGKHRKDQVNKTEDKFCYFALPFNGKKGCILDDINGPDTTLGRPGGGVVGSEDEVPCWAPDDAAF